ncbi:Ras-like GTPase domain-containing protein [Phanerochaete sordida]|uniref:Ras-like GTPase domain-containing protein n=1 Tax=Phanerochaete sordida TaxID=48140 RepID=A0A9P3LIQ7_9APHY|nr:Ras-like GTPase domain-containing protein [Phanerochaete sordida]
MSDVLIAVMGATGTGKSTFVNLISGSQLPVGEGLRSCTTEVRTSQPFELLGRRVTLIDTPGFDDTLKTDTEILKLIASYLANQYRENKKLSGVIYMHRISDFRVGGISRRNFGMFRSLCGDSTLANVVVVTNMWSEVSAEKGAAREHELATDGALFKPVLDKGAAMARHANTLASAQAILGRLVANVPLPLQIQRELVEEHKALEQTAASEELKTQEMREAQRRQEAELQRQREAAEAARRAQEAQKARELAEAQRQRAIQEAQAQAERERVQRELEAARRQEEERLRQVQLALQQEAAARAAEEERLRQVREQQAREAQAQEEARRQHQAEMERIRRRRRHDDCIIC